MNKMKRKEYTKPCSECVEMVCPALLSDSTIEVSGSKGDPDKPLLAPQTEWDYDEE